MGKDKMTIEEALEKIKSLDDTNLQVYNGDELKEVLKIAERSLSGWNEIKERIQNDIYSATNYESFNSGDFNDGKIEAYEHTLETIDYYMSDF